VKERGLTLNSLYSMGFTRVGCMGCPMAGTEKRKFEFRLYPHIKILYLRTFEKMLARLRANGKTTRWKNAADVMDWWLSDVKKSAPAADEIDGQLDLMATINGDYAAELEEIHS
jgi:3'-phosphoadenosine 5'-phosphosulfate sulfotransferase (PAPS reductase)/FAD synthetase